MSAQTDYLTAVTDPLIAMVVRQGPMYRPVCLRCGNQLRVLFTRRSFALVALDIHNGECAGRTSRD